jgi:hypothetical protein
MEAGIAEADENEKDIESEILQLENDLKLLARLSSVGEYDTAVQDAVEAAVLAVRPLPPSYFSIGFSCIQRNNHGDTTSQVCHGPDT